MLVDFNLFLTVVPNWNNLNSVWPVRKISSWYQMKVWIFCGRLCTLLGITRRIFPSVPSWFVFIISCQKLHSVVGCLVQSSYCLMYHQKRYTPHSLMATGYKFSISNCTKYHLACAKPSGMCFMKNRLSLDPLVSLLRCLHSLWSPTMNLNR